MIWCIWIKNAMATVCQNTWVLCSDLLTLAKANESSKTVTVVFSAPDYLPCIPASSESERVGCHNWKSPGILSWNDPIIDHSKLSCLLLNLTILTYFTTPNGNFTGCLFSLFYPWPNKLSRWQSVITILVNGLDKNNLIEISFTYNAWLALSPTP